MRRGAHTKKSRTAAQAEPALERRRLTQFLLLRGHSNLGGDPILSVHDRHLRPLHRGKTRGALRAGDLRLFGERELLVAAIGLDRERLGRRVDLDQLTSGGRCLSLRAGRRSSWRSGLPRAGSQREPDERDESDKIWGSMIKQTLKRQRPGFNESYHGFRSFNQLLEEAKARKLIDLEKDEKSGGYVVKIPAVSG